MQELDVKAKNARRVETTTREDMARADRKQKLLEEQADALRDEANSKALAQYILFLIRLKLFK